VLDTIVVYSEIDCDRMDALQEQIAAAVRAVRMPGAENLPCGAICAGMVRDGLECSPGRCLVRERDKPAPDACAP
jgi:hypothetical protein